MYRKTYLEVNVDNFRHNIRYLQKISGKKLIAIEKANGYGTNDIYMAKIALEEGIDFFGVSSLEEAVHFRKNGIDKNILILGFVEAGAFDLVRQYDLSIVTVSKNYVLENIEAYKGIKVHLKLNTGMNRIGVLPEEADEVLKALSDVGANVEGIMTHYARSDENGDYTQKQYQLFKKTLESLNYDFKYIHTCNTDATVGFEDAIGNYCRCGLGMFGYSEKHSELKPCLSLYAEVSNVKQVIKGEAVSYGGHYISDGEGYILTLPIGYADGFTRANTGLSVYVNGEIGTIVGSVCMDQLMVKVNKYYPVGTKVELWGEHIQLKDRARELKTISYELMSVLSDRVTRYFVSKDSVGVLNDRFDFIGRQGKI